MSESELIACTCIACPGSACDCGCQQAVEQSACACGPACNCGDDCNCAKAGGSEA